jgi:hypothetical protein
MSNEPKKRRSWKWIGWALVAALVLYPLSIGPATRWTDRDPSKQETVAQIYAPLWWMAARSEYLGDALPWYIGKWMVQASGEDGGGG